MSNQLPGAAAPVEKDLNHQAVFAPKTASDTSEAEKQKIRDAIAELEKPKQYNIYDDDLLKQTFSSLKGIVAIMDTVVVYIDEYKALQKAMEILRRKLGPEYETANPADFLAKAEAARSRTTAMSIQSALNTAMVLGTMLAKHPEMFGEGTNCELAEIIMEMRERIQEAMVNRAKLTGMNASQMARFKKGEEGEITDRANLEQYLGKDWKNKIERQLKARPKKLIFNGRG